MGNTNNSLGYYDGGFAGVSELVGLIPLLVIAGLMGGGVFFMVQAKKGDIKSAMLGVVVVVVAVLMVGIIVQIVMQVLPQL